MDYDDFRAHDPLRSAALVAATRCAVDDEPPTWEPETNADFYTVCKYREICLRAYMSTPFTDEAKAPKFLQCIGCEHFEDSGVSPV